MTLLKPKYVHPVGRTKAIFSSSGDELFTIGQNTIIRRFQFRSDGIHDEPNSVEHQSVDITDIVATKENFIVASKDGTVSLFSCKSNAFTKFILRSNAAIRAISLSVDEKWLAIAEDETIAKIVNVENITDFVSVGPHTLPLQFISFSPSSKFVATCMIDGTISLYTFDKGTATRLKSFYNICPTSSMEIKETSPMSLISWCASDSAFGVLSSSQREILLYSVDQPEKPKIEFKNGHIGKILDFKWSPNSTLLATAGEDDKIVLWNVETKSIIHTISCEKVCSIAWHPKLNIIASATREGLLYVQTDAVPESFVQLLYQQKPEIVNALERSTTNKENKADLETALLFDDGDSALEEDEELDGQSDTSLIRDSKKRKTSEQIRDTDASPSLHCRFHDPIDYSTPWNQGRRYLDINMIGHVWSLQNEVEYNTVSVEFQNTEKHRKYHFKDPDLFDKASLNEIGTVFANSGKNGSRSVVQFQLHSSWSQQQSRWRKVYPNNDLVEALTLTRKHAIVGTSNTSIRIYTIGGGVLVSTFRMSYSPLVAMRGWDDYLWIIGNGSARADGSSQLVSDIIHISSNECLQKQLDIPLRLGAKLKFAFVSEEGNPLIYDSDGIVSMLRTWHSFGQAQWVPVLDTSALTEDTAPIYWPLTATDYNLYCFILKNREGYPIFPRPITSEQALCIPVGDETSEDVNTSKEQEFLIHKLLLQLIEDNIPKEPQASDRARLSAKAVEIDRTLLHMIQSACIDERPISALDLTRLLNRSVSCEAARKIALHYDNTVLAQKITREIEKRE